MIETLWTVTQDDDESVTEDVELKDYRGRTIATTMGGLATVADFAAWLAENVVRALNAEGDNDPAEIRADLFHVAGSLAAIAEKMG